MNDETSLIEKPAPLPSPGATPTIVPPTPIPETSNGNGNGSAILGVSLRGWLALLLVGTLCALVTRFHTDKLVDAFVLIVGGAINFYFGQGLKK